jgi:putative ABC transport system permease protein
LILLLSTDYLLLIVIAFVVAVPVSYYVVSNYWLNNFAYRIEVNITVYAFALAGILLVSFITVGSQIVRAALRNPADILKEE